MSQVESVHGVETMMSSVQDTGRVGIIAVLVAVAVECMPTGIAAQADAGARGQIRGTVLDSTTMTRLIGAQVSVAGGQGGLVTDGAGTFRFEDVPPGDYPLVMSHPRLDTLGLTPILRTVEVAEWLAGRGDVDLWRARTRFASLDPTPGPRWTYEAVGEVE